MFCCFEFVASFSFRKWPLDFEFVIHYLARSWESTVPISIRAKTLTSPAKMKPAKLSFIRSSPEPSQG
jgi:hypothetical protein